jgi:hypothetical protein
VLNGTSVHLEMPLVMSRDLRLDINDGSRGVALLDDGGHDATDGIGRKIVVVIAHFAAYRNTRPANVQTAMGREIVNTSVSRQLNDAYSFFKRTYQ